MGGGYSVNFVPWHRDPVGPRDEGLRNLTVNLTAMPVITLFNHLKTTSYVYDDAINNSQLEIPDNLTDLDYRGIFHDWMLKGLVVYRF